MRPQNTYDTYAPAPSFLPLCPFPTLNYNNQGYTGEYQIFMPYHHWLYNFSQYHYLEYKIEPVSFPFIPDCSTGDCQNINSTQRVLNMPTNFTVGFGTHRGKFGVNLNNNDPSMSDAGNIMSNDFTMPFGSIRKRYPHTSLKHTFYIHSSLDPTSPIIDKFSFVYDHTRGMMSLYPFRNNNGPTGVTQHDITILPFFTFVDQQYYNSPNFNSNCVSTIDFYPYATMPQLFSNYYPDSLSNNSPPDLYLHPAPLALTTAILANDNLQPYAGFINTQTPTGGVPHNYVINQSINLSFINPIEKIIYNPSDVAVDITAGNRTLVFPYGYTFKTTYGLYPTATQVQQYDPFNLYADKTNVPVPCNLTMSDNIYTTTIDERKSIYRIRNGSILKIEPCVTINDAEIIVETGATLQYDNTRVFGNFIITNQGGTVVSNYPFNNFPPQLYPCAQPCYTPAFFDYLGGAIPWLTGIVTIDMNNYQTYFPGAANNTIKIGQPFIIPTGVTLTIGAGMHFEFGENGKIIVEQNAKLIASGTINNKVFFTSACDNMWKGIEVHANGFLPQSPTNSGTIDFTYAEIEDAHTAISNGKPTGNPRGGGIIKLNLCTLRNNGKGVDFFPYVNYVQGPFNFRFPVPDLSSVTNCIFETTERLRHNTYYDDVYIAPRAHTYFIGMKRNFYITVSGNTFKNTATDLQTLAPFLPHLRGTGIKCYDTWLKLNPGSQRNTFEGLSEGVWSSSTPFQSLLVVDDNEFNNNIHAIVLEGLPNSKIVRNKIKVPPSPLFGYPETALERGYDKPVGFYLIGSYGYRVEENEINVGGPVSHTGNQTNGSQCTYGIIINNTVNLAKAAALTLAPAACIKTIYKTAYILYNS